MEHPITHKLVGGNPAARWHIRVCGLNADQLVNERRRRHEHWRLLRRQPIMVPGDHQTAAELITKFREEVQLMIPEIPFVIDLETIIAGL